MDKYISSLAFSGMTPEAIVDIAKENNFAIEFSSGMPYRADMELFFKQAELKKIIHNYFPAPKEPFVLNLASANDEIRGKSIKHCLNGIDISAENSCPFFAAHAGFCIDPDPNDLGNQIAINRDFISNKHWEFFYESLDIIITHAKEKNVLFLIENNVLAEFNYKDQLNAFLCCESGDILKVFRRFPCENHFGLLLDTAHIKISCKTLGKNLQSELDIISPYVRAIHHSDNNGFVDNNLPINEDYWFLNSLKKFNTLPQVLEVRNASIKSLIVQLQLLDFYGN